MTRLYIYREIVLGSHTSDCRQHTGQSIAIQEDKRTRAKHNPYKTRQNYRQITDSINQYHVVSRTISENYRMPQTIAKYYRS